MVSRPSSGRPFFAHATGCRFNALKMSQVFNLSNLALTYLSTGSGEISGVGSGEKIIIDLPSGFWPDMHVAQILAG